MKVEKIIVWWMNKKTNYKRITFWFDVPHEDSNLTLSTDDYQTEEDVQEFLKTYCSTIPVEYR